MATHFPTDLRLLACSSYARRIHALRKTFTTFRRCICKRLETVADKMGDNEDLICDGSIRSAFSDCAIQVHLLANLHVQHPHHASENNGIALGDVSGTCGHGVCVCKSYLALHAVNRTSRRSARDFAW